MLKENDIVMASSGVTWGKTATVENNNLPLMLNTSVIRFRTIDEKLLRRSFLKIILNSLYFKRQINRLITGGCQPNFGPSHLKKVNLILPPPHIQDNIIFIVGKAEQLKELRNQSDKLTTEFLKKTFLSMFGNPIKNPKNWEVKKLGELTKRITKGESPEWQGFQYVEDGPLFIRSENVRWGYLDLKVQTRIPEVFYNKLERSQLHPNDVLINLVGASIGRAAVVPYSLGKANVNQAVAVITPNTLFLNPIYLVNLLLTPSVQSTIQKSKVESARANISLGDLRELLILVPPQEMQQMFASIVQQTEKIKSYQQKSKQEITNLLNILNQKVFGGI